MLHLGACYSKSRSAIALRDPTERRPGRWWLQRGAKLHLQSMYSQTLPTALQQLQKEQYGLLPRTGATASECCSRDLAFGPPGACL